MTIELSYCQHEAVQFYAHSIFSLQFLHGDDAYNTLLMTEIGNMGWDVLHWR